MSIPICILEEHHEAFYAWNYFVKKGWMKPENNYLLHIDHHDDMEAGGYDWDFTEWPENLEGFYQITYEKLGIADFIVPAIFEGLFSDVHIMKNVIPKAINSEKRLVKCKDRSQLCMSSYIPFIHAQYEKEKAENYQFFMLHTGGLTSWKTDKNIVLDIDLDYFCWDDSLSTRNPKRLELTKESYEEFIRNPYHPFRILPRKLLQAVEENGHYYIEYKENIAPDKLPEKKWLVNRLDNLCTWLKENELKPSVIDICRSSRSGYLPLDGCVYGMNIEEELIRRLSEIWGLERVWLK